MNGSGSGFVPPRHSPWLITVSVLLATFMEVLDTSIANVALPHIGGNLSATTEESTWILTSYLISNAIVLSATGWLSRYFGRKRYLTFSVLMFTASSALCGMAHSLPFLIVARVLQGLGGGGLQPLAQAILLESFAPKDRGVAMAAYGMGIVVAPIIGPSLGGWITDNYSWQWIFYINIPIGIIGLLMQNAFVEDPPHLTGDRTLRIDYVGFALMSVGIGWLQLVLDKGQQADWFEALWIRWSAVSVVAILLAFVVWEWTHKDPIVNLRLLKNRNFGTACTLMAMAGAMMYGSTVILPIFMQTLLGYSAFASGLSMTPRGLGSFLSMFVVGQLVRRVDGRPLIMSGLIGLAISSWFLGNLNLDIAPSNIALPLVLNGFCMGFVFVPMSTFSVATLKQEEIYQSTGLFSLMRNMGASIGISLIVALQSRLAQAHQATLTSHISQGNPAFVQRWQDLGHALVLRGVPVNQSSAGALSLLYRSMQQQATLLSFMDCFRWMAVMCVVFAPLVLLFRKGHAGGAAHVVAD